MRGSEQAIWEDVLDAVAARDDVTFAYRTLRQYRAPSETKPGLGGLRPDAVPSRVDDPD